MQRNRGGLGSHKHAISGHAGRNAAYKSKSRQEAAREEEAQRKRKANINSNLKSSSVREALKQ